MSKKIKWETEINDPTDKVIEPDTIIILTEIGIARVNIKPGSKPK